MNLIIDQISGNCPVQGDGTIDGVPWYFRARFEHWSMSIGPDPVGISCGEKHGWYREEAWGDGEYDAGYMPRDTAKQIIRDCAKKWDQEQRRNAR